MNSKTQTLAFFWSRRLKVRLLPEFEKFQIRHICIIFCAIGRPKLPFIPSKTNLHKIVKFKNRSIIVLVTNF